MNTNLKIFIIAITILITGLFIVPINAQAQSGSDVYVNGYYRSNGTYVQPHYRSAPNHNRYDNFSTYGNTNPYNNQRGTVHPERQNNHTIDRLNPDHLNGQPNNNYRPPLGSRY